MKTIVFDHLRLKLFLAMCLLIASCVSPAATRTTQESNVSAVPTTRPTETIDFTEIKASHPWRIAFIPKFKLYGETGSLSSYWQPAWEGAQKAGDDFGVQVDLVVSDTLGSTDAEYVEPQIRLVADLIEKGEIDGLVIAPFDSNRLAPVVEQAISAGIPVVAMDTPVNSDQLLSFVVFDNYSAGKAMGEWVVQQLGGNGNALLLDGPQDQQNAIDRRNGFLAGLRYGNINILDTESADWEIEPARVITADWLDRFAKVGAIIAANDNMALGAAQSISNANRKGILVTGFDATDIALQAVAAGQISATVDQAPGEQARLAIQILIKHLETGKTFPQVIYLPEIPIVTQDNVDTYLVQRDLK